MNEHGKSDGPIVPKTPANNGGGNRSDCSHPATSPAEQVEGRGAGQGQFASRLRGPDTAPGILASGIGANTEGSEPG